MKFTITFEVTEDDIDDFGSIGHAVTVVEDAVDHLLIDLELYPKHLLVKVDR